MIDQAVRQLGYYFDSRRWPTLSCPKCRAGHLLPEAVEEYPTQESSARYDKEGDPLEIEGVFIGRLVCANSGCGDSIAVSGEFVIDGIARESWDDSSWGSHFRVRALVPTIPLVLVAPEVPDAIAAELRRCAQLIWTDAGAGLWALRCAVEQIMADKGIASFGPKKNPANGTRFVPLHERIESFAAIENGKYLEPAQLLESVKWVGNEGTHSPGSADEKAAVASALEMVEILETALRLIYPIDHSAALARAAQINANKGYVAPPTSAQNSP